MTSQAKLAACRLNSLKSTGPNTPEGLAKSSMNAFKHGMRAKKLELLRGDSIAFENRLHKWIAISDPHDDMGEFLVHQNVCMSFEVERARRAHLEGLTSLIENSADTEVEEVFELGKRLFFDPTGPAQLYGNAGVARPRKLRTSWNGQAVDPNDPATLVRKLESSEPGCWFLRGCWEDLRAKLEPGKFWQSHDRLAATRLLGCQPLDSIAVRRVAEIFVASHALNPIGKTPFDDLQSDITTTSGLDRFRQDVQAQWPDLVSTKDTARCREILIELVDQSIEELTTILEEHAASADANAQKTVDRLSVDNSPDGQRLRAYHMKCVSALFRGVETFRKYQGKKKAEGEPRKIQEPRRWPEDSRRRIADFARWAPPADASDLVSDGSVVGGDGERESFEPSTDWDALPDGEAQADCGTGTAGATQSAGAAMMTDTTLSAGVTVLDNISALASATLSDGITPLERSELDAGAGDAAGNTGIARELTQDVVGRIGNPSHVAFADLFPGGASPEVSDADAVPDRGDAMSQWTEKSQNVTNEAKIDEAEIIIQNKEAVGVAANSGVESGLDTGQEPLGVSRGKEELIRAAGLPRGIAMADLSAQWQGHETLLQLGPWPQVFREVISGPVENLSRSALLGSRSHDAGCFPDTPSHPTSEGPRTEARGQPEWRRAEE